MNESNHVLKKKWDDALGAMGKRDETLQTVQDAQTKLRSQLSDNESKLRSSKLEKEDVEKRLFIKEIGIARFEFREVARNWVCFKTYSICCRKSKPQ